MRYLELVKDMNDSLKEMGLGEINIKRTVTIKYDDYMSLLSLIDDLMEEIKAKDKIIKELKREV